jgi:hypothetical protein
MAVDDRGCHVHDLAVRGASLVAEHLERAPVVDRVTLHQDALGAFDDRPAPECALEVVVLKRRSTMSIELCQSLASASLM